MKHFKIFCMALAAMLSFAACDSDDPAEPVIDPVETHEVLVLNNGNWGSNDACITCYDLVGSSLADHVFSAVNGQQLGDLGQDIIRNADEYYIAVNGSQVVFVTDLDLRIKHQIVAEADGARLSPRYLCAQGDRVYVTYYEGYLGEINTKDYSVRTTSVGLNPEGLAYVAGRIYVANSGGLNYLNGYDNTLSVVDAATFAEVQKITVNVNPQMVIADEAGTTLYVNSFGNYADVPAMLQSVSLASGQVEDLPYADVKGMACCDQHSDRLYVVTGSYDDNWQVQGTINLYDMKHRTAQAAPLVEGIKDYYSISVAAGNLCVGTSDYKTNGNVFIYNAEGLPLSSFDAAGLNPIKVLKR